MKIRASKAHLAFACGQSLKNPSVQIRVIGDDQARTGSAVHDAAPPHIAGVSFDKAELLRKWDVDEDEFAYLFGCLKRCWRMLASWFPEPQTEQFREFVFLCQAPGGADLHLTGHIDVESVVDDEVRIIDWKTGRIDDDHNDQVKIYSLLSMLHHAKYKARAFVVRVRDVAADPFEYTREELLKWLGGEADRLSDTEYHVGRHCTYCPRSHECPAKEALLKQSALVLANDAVATDFPIEPALRGPRLAAMLDRVKMLENFCRTFRAACKADVAGYGGELPAGDGRYLQINREERESIIYEDCEDILQEALGGRLKQILKVSKTALLDAVKADAAMKSAAANEMMERLRAAGAVKTTYIDKLELKRASKEKKS